MAGYNNFGVPEYARSDTPAIRPKPPVLPESDKESWRAKRMEAIKFVKGYFDQHWKNGDRFVFTTDPGRMRGNHKDTSKHAGQSGVFHRRVLRGYAWMVEVTWDDPNYKPRGSYNCVGMFDFYHFAEKQSGQ